MSGTSQNRHFYFLVSVDGHEDTDDDGVFFVDRVDAVRRKGCTVAILYASGEEREIVSTTPQAAREVFDGVFEACTGGKTLARKRPGIAQPGNG